MPGTLPIAYRDVDAAQLRLSFALQRLEPLRVATLRFPGASVELAILSASHQVRVAVDGRLVAAEAVACEAAGELLPRSAAWSGDDCRLQFSSRIRRLTDAAFSAAVGRLGALLSADPCAVIGLFPSDPAGPRAGQGDDHAVTALRARRLPTGRIGWRTWHAYPRTRELVTTQTAMVARGAA